MFCFALFKTGYQLITVEYKIIDKIQLHDHCCSLCICAALVLSLVLDLARSHGHPYSYLLMTVSQCINSERYKCRYHILMCVLVYTMCISTIDHTHIIQLVYNCIECLGICTLLGLQPWCSDRVLSREHIPLHFYLIFIYICFSLKEFFSW